MQDGGFEVARLTASEVAAMRAVLAVYSQAFSEPENYQHKQPSDDYLVSLLERPDFVQLAAFSGGEVIGALSAYVLAKFEQERSEIYIYDLAVLEPFRRRGIAEQLIRALAPIAKAAAAHVVFVQADKGDAVPTALYRKLGEQEDVLHFDLNILD